MSPQPKPELIPLTDHVSVPESQLLDTDLPQLTEINFLNGVIGVDGTPAASAIGLYATDVPIERVKNFVDPGSASGSLNPVDRLYRQAGVANSDTCDTTVLQAWHARSLTVIKPVALPYPEVPALVNPPELVSDIFKMLFSGDSTALHRMLTDPALDIQAAMRSFTGPLRLRHRAAAITLGFALLKDAGTSPGAQAAKPGDIPVSSLYTLWPDLEPAPPAAKVDLDTILTRPGTRYLNPGEATSAPPVSAPPVTLIPGVPAAHKPAAVTPGPRQPRPAKLPQSRVARESAPKRPETAYLPKREITPWQYDEAAGIAHFNLGETTITCRFDNALSHEEVALLTRAWFGKSYRKDTLPETRAMPTKQELMPIRQALDDPLKPASVRELLCRHIQDGYVSFEPVTSEPILLGENRQAILDMLLSGASQAEIGRRLPMVPSALSKNMTSLKLIFGVPAASEEMLIFAAYATGYRPVPKPNTAPFQRSAVAPEQAAETLATYPIVIREPVSVSPSYPVQYRANKARTRYAAPVEEGDLIHWAGGIFKRNFPADTSEDQMMSRALALHCFDLSEPQIAELFKVPLRKIMQCVKEAEALYELSEDGLGANIRSLFDREWLTVVQEVPVPDYKLHPKHLDVMQILHTAHNMEEVGEYVGLAQQSMSQIAVFCRNLIGVHNTRSILTLSYGMKFFLPEKYYKEAQIEPLDTTRSKTVTVEEQAEFEARKAAAMQAFSARFTVPQSIQVKPGKFIASAGTQLYPLELARPVEDGEYIHWGGGVLKRHIDAEAFGLADEAVRTLVLSGLGYATEELALHYDGLENAASALAHARKQTGLPLTELGLTRSLFAQKWLTVEDQMALPDQALFRIKFYEEDIDYLRLLRDATKIQDFTDALGTSRQHNRSRIGHLKKFFGVASMAGVLAAAHGTGFWVVGDTPEQTT